MIILGLVDKIGEDFMSAIKDEIYNNLKQLEIVLEKSLPIIPSYLSVVKVDEINRILKQLYDCLPLELKNSESNLCNLLRQFEYIVNNSFPVLPNYLVAVKLGKLEQIIDQIYVTTRAEVSSNGSIKLGEEECAEQLEPSSEMKFLLMFGKIIKSITPLIPIVVVVGIIAYSLGVDKCYSMLLEIVNNISK